MIVSRHFLVLIRSGFWKAKFSVASVYLHHSSDGGGQKPPRIQLSKKHIALKQVAVYSVFIWSHGGHVGGVNKATAAMLEEGNILLGIKLYFYANSSFCFIMQIWLLVTWANTLCCSNSLVLILAMTSFFPSPYKTSSRSRWQKNQRQRS